MFTGIVEEQGFVEALTQKPNLCVLKVRTRKIAAGVKVGDSICVSGVCLTVTSSRQMALSFDIMLETIRATGLKGLHHGSRVNLERALKVNSRFDGHFVTGHVDATGAIVDRIQKKNYVELRITVPESLRRFIVPKGSICVDGVSLTVGEVTPKYFSVYLIPHTLKVTTFGLKRAGDKVNLEADILARYILK